MRRVERPRSGRWSSEAEPTAHDPDDARGRRRRRGADPGGRGAAPRRERQRRQQPGHRRPRPSRAAAGRATSASGSEVDQHGRRCAAAAAGRPEYGAAATGLVGGVHVRPVAKRDTRHRHERGDQQEQRRAPGPRPDGAASAGEAERQRQPEQPGRPQRGRHRDQQARPARDTPSRRSSRSRRSGPGRLDLLLDPGPDQSPAVRASTTARDPGAGSPRSRARCCSTERRRRSGPASPST